MALPVPVFVETGTLTFGTNQYTKNTPGAGIGTAFATRRVILMMAGIQLSGRTVTGVTIGGVTATIHYGINTAENAYSGCASAIVPLGTTADIVVAVNNTVFTSLTYDIYTVNNDDIAAVTTGTTSVASGQSIAPSCSSAFGGFALTGVGYSNGSSRGIITTPDFTLSTSGGPKHFAYRSGLPGGTLTATTSWTDVAVGAAAGIVSWAPAIPQLLGSSITPAAGTLSPVISKGLTGSSSATAAGTLSIAGSATVGAVGESSTTAAGTLGPVTSVGLSGPTSGVAVSLKGQSITSVYGNVSGIQVSLTATHLTLTGTTAFDLSGGAWGFAFSIGEGVPLDGSTFVTGNVSSQSITMSFADLGVSIGQVLNIDPFYNVDPYGVGNFDVFASESGGTTNLLSSELAITTGVVGIVITVPLTGIASEAFTGNLGASANSVFTTGLTGAQSVSGIGTVGVECVVSLTGIDVMTEHGVASAASQLNFILTGISIAASTGTVTPVVVLETLHGVLTFADMQDEVRAALGNRTDLNARIPRAINIAQQRLARIHDFDEMETIITIDILNTGSDNNKYMNLPNKREIFSIVLLDGANSRKLVQRTPQFWDRLLPMPEYWARNRPSDYVIWNNTVEMWPLPNATYTLRVRWSKWPTALVNDWDTSEFLQKDDILIEIAIVYILNSLGKEDDAAKHTRILGQLLTEAIRNDDTKPDITIAPSDQNSLGISGDPWNNPFIKEL